MEMQVKGCWEGPLPLLDCYGLGGSRIVRHNAAKRVELASGRRPDAIPAARQGCCCSSGGCRVCCLPAPCSRTCPGRPPQTTGCTPPTLPAPPPWLPVGAGRVRGLAGGACGHTSGSALVPAAAAAWAAAVDRRGRGRAHWAVIGNLDARSARLAPPAGRGGRRVRAVGRGSRRVGARCPGGPITPAADPAGGRPKPRGGHPAAVVGRRLCAPPCRDQGPIVDGGAAGEASQADPAWCGMLGCRRPARRGGHRPTLQPLCCVAACCATTPLLCVHQHVVTGLLGTGAAAKGRTCTAMPAVRPA